MAKRNDPEPEVPTPPKEYRQQTPSPQPMQQPVQQYYQPPNQYDYRVTMPSNELQYNMMTTESTWGQPEMNPAVKDTMTGKTYAGNEDGSVLTDEDGEPILVEVKQGWELFSMYTRDFRLANLDDDEKDYVDAHTDIAFQLLQNNFPNSAKVALGYSATCLETSQSKKGFLRKRQNTLTTENINRDLEPPKKKLFSKGSGE